MKRINAGLAVALGLLMIAVGGLLHVRYGGWRSGPGVGAHLVPMLAYWVVLLSLVPILWSHIRGHDAAQKLRLPAPLLPLLAVAAWGAAFFMMVLHVGLFTGTAIALSAAIIALSGPGRSVPRIIALAVLLATVFFAIFTQVAPILLRDPVAW